MSIKSHLVIWSFDIQKTYLTEATIFPVIPEVTNYLFGCQEIHAVCSILNQALKESSLLFVFLVLNLHLDCRLSRCVFPY